MGGSLASVHSIAEDNFIFSLIQDSSEQKKFSSLGEDGHEPSNNEDSEYIHTWLGALIWLQWEWEDGTVWDYHNWNKGEIAFCILVAFSQGSGPEFLAVLEIWKKIEDFVLHALRALRPCDPRNGAMIG